MEKTGKASKKMPAWLSCFACGKSSGKDGDDDDVKTASAAAAPPEVKVAKGCAAPKVEVTKIEETKITAEAPAVTEAPPLQLKDDPAVIKQPSNDEDKRDAPAAEVVVTPDAVATPGEPISVELREEVAAAPDVTPSPQPSPPSPKEAAATTAAETAATTTAAATDAIETGNSNDVNHAGSENTAVANENENINGVQDSDNGVNVKVDDDDDADAAELERFEALERTLVDGADAVVGAISADREVEEQHEEEGGEEGGKASPFKTDYSSDGALSDLEHADDDEFLVASPPDNPGHDSSVTDNPANDNSTNGDSARDKPSSHIPSRIGRATGIPLLKSAVSPPPPSNDTLITPVSKSPPTNDASVTPVSKKVSASRLPTPASKIPTANSSNSNNNTPSSKIPMPRSGPRKSQSGIPARIR